MVKSSLMDNYIGTKSTTAVGIMMVISQGF